MNTATQLPDAAQHYSEVQMLRREMHWQDKVRRYHEVFSDWYARRGNVEGKNAHERQAADAGQKIRRMSLRVRELEQGAAV